MRAENFPNVAKDQSLPIQHTGKISNRINPKKPTPRNIIVKLLRTKNRKIRESSQREMIPYLWEKSNENGSRFPIRDHGGQKEVEGRF